MEIAGTVHSTSIDEGCNRDKVIKVRNFATPVLYILRLVNLPLPNVQPPRNKGLIRPY